MNGSLRAQCIAEFLGTGLFLFWYLLPERPETDRRQPGLWEICIIWGLGISLAVYLTAGISGTSEPRGHRRPVAVCLLPGQKSGALYRGSGRRRVWRRRAGWILYSTLFTQFETVHHMVRGSWKACSWPVYSVPTRRLSSASGMRRWWRW